MSYTGRFIVIVLAASTASIALALFLMHVRLPHYGDWALAVMVADNLFNMAALVWLYRKRRLADGPGKPD